MSPCPNDTFMFHALLHDHVPSAGVQLEAVMDDIEGLNQRALKPTGRLPYTKLSSCAFGHVLPAYRVLRAGAALGRGCGPLIVVREDSAARRLADLQTGSIAIPGFMTTAWLLTRMYGPSSLRPVECRYDQIMEQVAVGSVDAGLIIHESRFTYAAQGLRALSDLGTCWEEDAGLPLPLGLIAARRDLEEAEVCAMEDAIAASVRYGWEHPERGEAWVRQHAQEMQPEVCSAHIRLYVNQYSEDLGEDGRRAVEYLLRRGHEVGALPRSGASPWG